MQLTKLWLTQAVTSSKCQLMINFLGDIVSQEILVIACFQVFFSHDPHDESGISGPAKEIVWVKRRRRSDHEPFDCSRRVDISQQCMPANSFLLLYPRVALLVCAVDSASMENFYRSSNGYYGYYFLQNPFSCALFLLLLTLFRVQELRGDEKCFQKE